jgi:riboflavin biosynthesis pyrimidine reductase
MTKNADFALENSSYEVFKDGNFALVKSYSDLLEKCKKHNISSVYIEGGSKILTYFLTNKYFDEINLYYACKLGGGKSIGFFENNVIQDLSDFIDLKLIRVKKIDDCFLVVCK